MQFMRGSLAMVANPLIAHIRSVGRAIEAAHISINLEGMKNMTKTTLEKWVWILIYGGLLVAGLGLSILQRDGGLGLPVTLAGALAVTLGVVCIFVRSRMK